MFFHKLEEAGYESALLGLSLSFYDHKIPLLATCSELKHSPHNSRLLTRTVDEPTVFWTDARLVKAEKIGNNIANKIPSIELGDRDNHDYVRAEQKFLRSIQVWAYIQAPRSFWSEFDTYQIGMTKNSSSTMHTLDKRPVELSDFSAGTSIEAVDMFNLCLLQYKDSTSPYYKDIARLKENLPEGWLQERQICTNYAVLQNIINQRYKHRLHYWRYLCTEIMKQVDHPELLSIPEK